MGEPAVEFLLGRGRFDAEIVNQVALIWTLLSLGIFPFAFGTFIAKLCQAMRLPFIIFLSGLISFSVTWLMINWGSATGQIAVIALAPALAFTVTTIFWLTWLLRRLSLPLSLVTDLSSALVRSIITVGPAIAVDFMIAPFMDGLPSFVILFVRGMIFTSIGVAFLFFTRQNRWFFSSQPE